MTFAMQSLHKMSFVEETDYGSQPALSNHRALRHSGCELSLIRNTIESDEINENRQLSDVVSGVGKIEGDIDFELSFGSYDQLLEGVLGGSWTSDVLKVSAEFKSYTFERNFQDIGEFQQYSGCVIDQMTLSIRPDSIIGGRFSVLGKGMTVSKSSSASNISTGTSFAPMDSFQAEISEKGTTLAYVVGIDLSIKNNAEEHYVLGADTAEEISLGKSRISGEISAYFQNDDLIQKFLNREKSSLSIILRGEGGAYELLLPKIRYSGLEMPVKGDKAVVLTLPFMALIDETEGTSVKLTRTAM